MVKKKDELPDLVLDDIKNAKFAKPEPLTKMGYILEIYKDDKKLMLSCMRQLRMDAL